LYLLLSTFNHLLLPALITVLILSFHPSITSSQ
jgi:hypothetical protein